MRSYVDLDGQIIGSGDTLKILGFIFASKPDASAHVEEIERKFYNRLWLIRQLRKIGWNKRDIVRIYKSVLLPVIEYPSIVYHSLLNGHLKNKIESIQRRALKIIFGWEYSYQ